MKVKPSELVDVDEASESRLGPVLESSLALGKLLPFDLTRPMSVLGSEIKTLVLEMDHECDSQ